MPKKHDKKDIKRIIDANLNRLREGLRVIEEVARFLNNNKKLAVNLKKLRHGILQCEKKFPWTYQDLLKARNSAGDFGRKRTFDIGKKENYQEILAGNFRRTQESARVLEEFSNLINDKTAGLFKTIRFQLYDFEKEIMR
ncbi:MAG: thiamine-phosphate pyrophosphorylase [bacterium]